eukprot:CAMPEP_0181202942 /NCGR_PEP_ID=MMETSP1096-20121128/19119_1 /TAXON_ID=156174 ORGANISM="Chrysochromulina ericina, Strain CCMP281" /NCGR_SAMPLE_ID=MMETSP1096 /ASSEMBLY_ACC=CAM_ASM_000453 /LENGTH=115 /DNA_ID=CAMNT_0023293505 /DNA_START=87 /DNA_END=431 /DNA_ORIENTATION=+
MIDLFSLARTRPQREPQPSSPRRAVLLIVASSVQTKINCVLDVIVQLSRSALLFLLYILILIFLTLSKGLGGGRRPCGREFVAAAVNAVVFSPTKAAGAWAGGRGRWRGGAQGWG